MIFCGIVTRVQSSGVFRFRPHLSEKGWAQSGAVLARYSAVCDVALHAAP
jgi:hypothetical protein